MSQAHVYALMGARRLLENDGCEFVCDALPHTPAGREILQAVEESIYPYGTVTSWYRHTLNASIFLRAKAYRLAWIDWMIEGWRDAP